MPVPDTFMIAPDFCECPFCLECYPNTECRHGLFKINDYDKTGRACYICKKCLQKAQTDRRFDEEITARVFREKLGKLVKVTAEDKIMTEKEIKRRADEYARELVSQLYDGNQKEKIIDILKTGYKDGYLAGLSDCVVYKCPHCKLLKTNQFLKKDNNKLKQALYYAKKNVFAELNDETAESNEWLLGRVQDLEAENAELKEQLKKIEEGWF